MDILWKGVIGGIVTAFIAWTAKRGTILPGVIPLFPTFAIIALLIVGSSNNASSFRQITVSGMKTLPAYLAFSLGAYLATSRLDYRIAIIIGIACWAIVVLGIFLILTNR